MTSSRPIILASQSPRRLELLQKMGVAFKVIPSKFDEQLDHARSVEEVAVELALGKAQDVAADHPVAIVIGSDTIVVIDGKQLGKPVDEDDARRTLINLAGRSDIVCTGLAVICKELDIEITESATSTVFFKPYNKQAMEKYLASGDWYDKAGSYGIQSGAASLVDHIEGDYDSILGLPTRPLADILSKLGVVCHPAQLDPPVAVKTT